MTDLLKFRIPALFVDECVVLSATEIVYGYQDGWINAVDTGAVALASYRVNWSLSESVENLALLLLSDIARVPELVEPGGPVVCFR